MLSGVAADYALCFNHLTYRYCSWSFNGTFHIGVSICGAEEKYWLTSMELG